MNETSPVSLDQRGRVDPAPGLWLERIRLTDFRCYEGATVETDGRPVVLTGPNGAGKTNLLEAISFLAPGRGLRRARLSEIDRLLPGETPGAAARPWAVAGRIQRAGRRHDLGTGRDPGRDAERDGDAGNGRERRLVRIDGDTARGQQALGELISIVWLTPQMDGLFREGAAGRRRFLDRLVYGFDPEHASRVAAYEQVLRERARLLKSGRGDDAWLASLETSMAGRAIAIAAARRALVARLARACAAAPGPFPKAGVGLIGEAESWLDELSALEAEERLGHALRDARPRDAEAGGAAVGPHRSDLAVRHLDSGQEAALCSTGQQKALLVSILLAYARLIVLERGQVPLLLLDEVAAHLDGERRAALFDQLVETGAQAWLTGTDRALFAGLEAHGQFFQVDAARIERVL